MVYQSEIEKLEARFREKPEQWFAALADQYRKAGDVDMALELLNAWIDKRPNYTSGYIVLGRCLLDQERLGDAANAFENVLRLDMENVIALKSLSEIAEQRGDLNGARTWLKRLLDADPMNEEAREALENVGRPKTGEVVAVETAEAEEPAPDAAALEAAEPAEPPVAQAVDASLDIERSSEPEGFTLPEPEVAEAADEVEAPRRGVEEESVEPVGAEEPAASTEPAGASDAIEPIVDLEPAEFEAPSDVESAAVEGLEPPGYAGPAEEPPPEEPPEKLTERDELGVPAEERPFATPESLEFEPRPEEAEPVTGLGAAAIEPSAPEPPAETALAGVPELEEYTEPPEPAAAFEEDTLLAGETGEAELAQEPEPAEEFEPTVASAPPDEQDEVRFIEPPAEVEEEPEPEEEAAEAPPVAEQEPEEARPELPIILPEEVAPELDEPGIREPEPVVTETMAELYVSQGLYAEARDIYGKLLEHNPGSERIRNRLAEVVEQAAGAKAEAAPSKRDRYAAAATGGLSVSDLMRQLASAPGEAEGAGTGGTAAAEAEGGAGFSFDEYFGSGDAAQDSSSAAEATESPASESEQEERPRGPEDEDFRDWLEGLKT
jgi:tetratricopeptide (TPR) repeat protein